MVPHSAASGKFVFPSGFTREKQADLYGEIVRLYDLVDGLLSALQKDNVRKRDLQLELATPFVTQVTNSANILSAFYNEIVNKNMAVTPELRDTLERAVSNIFVALKELVDHTEEALLPKDQL